MAEQELKNRFEQNKRVSGKHVLDAMLNAQRYGYQASEVRKAKQQSFWLLVAWVAIAFTIGFISGTTLEQLKDTPRNMHMQEANHGQ